MIGKIGRGFSRLRAGLLKTRESLGDGVRAIVRGRSSFDEEMWEELEELLLRSDAGAVVAEELVEELRREAGRWTAPDADQVFEALRSAIAKRLGGEVHPLNLEGEDGPAVVLVIGVNGAGKTTTIGKLARQLTESGRRVLVVAGDTYRAAAMEQLAVWAERAGVEIVKGVEGQDAGAVVWDGLDAAVARGSDVVLIDTAGRLRTKSGLMDELVKVRRVVERRLPGAPQEVLLVLDATTGQNALQQARVFDESLGITGLVLAKLDGTAKGGVVLAIRKELDVPVKLVGVGEKIEDLQEFDPAAFAGALAPGQDASAEGEA